MRYMKKWYLFYADETNMQILQRSVGEFQIALNQYSRKLQRLVGESSEGQILHQLGAEFPQAFALVPWGQHIEIITLCRSVEEALFYIKETIEKGLSRTALRNVIKAKLFEHQGKIINNFSEHLPALQSKLVQEVLKENYDFGFATVGHEIYDETAEAIKKIIPDLINQGYKEFTVGCEEDNKNALHIYNKLGFTTKIQHGYGDKFDPSEYDLYLKKIEN